MQSSSSQSIDKIIENTDDSNWKNAFEKGYGEYDFSKNLIIKGSFFLPDFTDKTEITFYAKSLTENQSLYVNGKLLAEGIKRDDPNQVYVLDHNILKKGENIVVFVGKPTIAGKVLVYWYPSSEITFDSFASLVR